MNRDTARPLVKTRIPGPKAISYIQDKNRFLAPSTQEDIVIDIDGANIGPYFTDIDGNIFLDFANHVASSALGYNHPEILKILEEFRIRTPLKLAGQDFYYSSSFPTVYDLAEKLLFYSKKFGLEMVFFSNSGAEAIENGIKICYAHRQARFAITFYGAFHGRTLGALSLNRSKIVHRKGFPALADVIALPYCSCKDECRCGWRVKERFREVSQLELLLDPDSGRISPEEIAFIILEPIQGEGGYNFPNNIFLKDIKWVAERFSIPIIVDEVQSGLGRTGKFWAIEHFGIEPDVICSAKALCVGATIAKRFLFPEEKGRISNTWGGGDILGSIIGYKTIQIIEKYDLMKNAQEMGGYFLKRLSELHDKFGWIVDVRGLGLMDAIELDSKQRRDEFLKKLYQRGLLVLGCGHKTIRFLPPLDVRKREIDQALQILYEAASE